MKLMYIEAFLLILMIFSFKICFKNFQEFLLILNFQEFSNIFILKLFETNFKEYQILMSKYNFEKISINNEKNKARIIIK